MDYLSRQEELVLLAAYRLKENATLVSIRGYLNENTENHWAMSTVFIPLDRLRKSGKLEATIGKPTARRGGRAQKFYRLTSDGINDLKKVQKVHNVMWSGLTELT